MKENYEYSPATVDEVQSLIDSLKDPVEETRFRLELISHRATLAEIESDQGGNLDSVSNIQVRLDSLRAVLLDLQKAIEEMELEKQEASEETSIRDKFPEYRQAEQRGLNAIRSFSQKLLRMIDEEGIEKALGSEYLNYDEKIREILSASDFSLNNFGKGSLPSIGILGAGHAVVYLHSLDLSGVVSEHEYADLQRYHLLFHEPLASQITTAFYGREASKYPLPNGGEAIQPDIDRAGELINSILSIYPLS